MILVSRKSHKEFRKKRKILEASDFLRFSRILLRSLREINPFPYNVLINFDNMIRIENTLLEELIAKAKTSPRRRQHHNLHKSYGEYLQRFLNAVEPGSYIRPHRHLSAGKTEIFVPLKGRFLVLIFNEKGDVIDHEMLVPSASPYLVEIAPETYHTVCSLETGSVAFEIKDGPFDPAAAKDFATWAPEEGTPEADAYLRSIVLQTTGIVL